MSLRTFEATACGDVMHFAAPDLDDAQAQLDAMCGPTPAGMVSWRELDALPAGQEYAADMRS